MKYIPILMLACFLVLAPVRGYAVETGIAIVVNEDAISVNDLNDRMILVMASSRLPNRPEVRQTLAPQVINSLVEEQLKLQEAARLEIEVTPEEIANGFATIAGQNDMQPDQFRSMLNGGGVNVATMERQIRSQIAWSKVVQASLRSRVTITDNDVENLTERLRANIGKTEYLVAEIVLAVPDVAQESEIRDLATKIIGQARSGQASFFRLAQQFSSAPGAPQGGDLGWIQEGQLSAELDSTLLTMGREEISNPIRTPAGYHILALRDTRVISEETIPPEQQIRNTLGMERLDRLQQRRLMDLKAAAFIENRLQNPTENPTGSQ